jgi:DNA-binding Lrp family transcriptional regulator
MRAIFIQMKCELGKTYEVAAEAVDTIEEVSEVYSTSGHWDLLIKCYLPVDMDIGRFVADKIQTLPHIRDTHTIITFNAFT